MPKKGYSKSSNKTLRNMVKQYGSEKGRRVFYALANKRTGGFKGRNRGQRAANAAFKKGASWKSGRKSTRRSRTSRKRIRG